MDIQFEYLADRPEAVDTVIQWWATTWADRMGPLDKARQQLLDSLGKASLPLHILATHDGQPIGTAVLKNQELGDLYPDYQFWLGSVFVDQTWRGAGLASRLAEHIADLARQRQLPHLYLQTINISGGLYARLGWMPVEEFDYRGERTLLMFRKL